MNNYYTNRADVEYTEGPLETTMFVFCAIWKYIEKFKNIWLTLIHIT